MSDIDPAVARAVDEIDYVGCNTVNPYNYLAEIMFLTSAAWSSGAKRFTLSAIAARAALWVAYLDEKTDGSSLHGLRRRRGRARRILEGDVVAEYQRAYDKHHGRTPFNPEVTEQMKFVILAEEVGEVARALTPDADTPVGHAGNLRDELIQVAAMALAWCARIVVDTERRNNP